MTTSRILPCYFIYPGSAVSYQAAGSPTVKTSWDPYTSSVSTALVAVFSIVSANGTVVGLDCAVEVAAPLPIYSGQRSQTMTPREGCRRLAVVFSCFRRPNAREVPFLDRT